MNPLVELPITLSEQFSRALNEASTEDAGALQRATDAFGRALAAQLHDIARARGGAYAAAFSHAVVKTPLAPYFRRDFTQVLPTELAWRIFENGLSVDDFAALAQVNNTCHAWTRDKLDEDLLAAMRWERLPVTPQRVDFHDEMRSERHWGFYLQPNPQHSSFYLLTQDNAVEVAQIEGGDLVQRALHATESSKPPCAWHPSGETYAYVAGKKPTLHLCTRGGDVLSKTTLPFERVQRISFMAAAPHHLFLNTGDKTIAVDAAEPTQALFELPGKTPNHWPVTPSSAVRPWVVRADDDNKVLVVDCSGAEPRVVHTLDMSWAYDGGVAWHPTRPMFVICAEQGFRVVNLEGDAPTIAKAKTYDLIRFRNSGMHSTCYVAWEPSGRNLFAVSCSDELIIARAHADRIDRIAVKAIADVNGRGINWSQDGHVEVIFNDGELRRYKPKRAP